VGAGQREGTDLVLPARRETQIHWARRRNYAATLRPRPTLLYQRHFHGDGSVAAHSQGPLFPQLRPEDIANHASSVIRGQGEADALSGQRWTDTWSHQSNYVEDLIAYLFRPGPYVVRIRDTKLALSEMVARGVNLGELVSRDSGCVTPTRPPRRFARRACAR
jgi:hypothetical protein